MPHFGVPHKAWHTHGEGRIDLVATFIQSCACNGARPRQISKTPFVLRNRLLSRMMHDRAHVRYLLAPTGFGKTALAASYAQLVNSFEETAWVDGSNPCFLRDLDKGTMGEKLLSVVGQGAVVVFDDVPALDSLRAGKLWEACGTLLAQGCEVVATAAPCSDPLSAFSSQCLFMGPAEMLFSDEDFAALRSTEVSACHLAPPRGLVDRVPCLAAQTPGSYESFLAQHILELGEVSQQAVSLVALVLEKGTSDDLCQALGRELSLEELDPAGLRPFLSTDCRMDTFDASGMPLAEVLRAFVPVSGPIAKAVGEPDASRLAVRLANILAGRGSLARATSLMVGMAMPAVRAGWLRSCQDLLLARVELAAGEELFDSLAGSRYRSSGQARCGSMVRRSMLGVLECSSAEAASAVSCSDASLQSRLMAASVFFLVEGMREEAQGALQVDGPTGSCIAYAAKLSHGLSSGRGLSQLASAGTPTPIVLLARFWRSPEGLRDSLSSLADELEVQVGKLGRTLPAVGPGAWRPTAGHPWCPANISCMLAACLLRAAIAVEAGKSELNRLADLAAACLHASASQHVEGACEVLLRRLLASQAVRKRHLARRMRFSALRLDTIEASIEVQKAAYLRSWAESSAGQCPSAALRSGSTYAYTRAPTGTPLLHVGVFGRFEVRRGDEALAPKGFRRSKVRTLIALLALEDGRDLSCERLGAKLWPDSTPDCARHNLYSTISLVKRGLSLPGGSCPYLHRESGVVGFNPDMVRSDISDLELLCHRLRFDEVDPDAFLGILEQVRVVYRGELLPGEEDEALIVAARAAWSDKLVASLMVGARRMAALSDRQVALQLAQHALDVDPRREECYELLMGLQADCGQRPAAIDTWFTYCRYVDAELGLEPSPRVKDLYNKIIS